LLLATAIAQTPTYKLNVSADEVVLTFFAADAHDKPVTNLQLSELTLLDNGQPPRKILSFTALDDAPIRAGILLDASASMHPYLAAIRTTASQLPPLLLRTHTGEAFAMQFGHLAQLIQPWTTNPNALVSAIGTVSGGSESRLAGTAIYDTLYRACATQYSNPGNTGTANVVLLFSDGEDTASTMGLEQAVAMCQRTNTVIDAFRAGTEPNSTGPATLAELARQTGGVVYRLDAPPAELATDIHSIESTLRNHYRLIYRPASLQPDGSFHRITLETPDRVATLQIRSGYYAPTH
jgi:VWFA-related protein